MHLKRENQQANECFNLLISFLLLCSFFLNESSARKDTIYMFTHLILNKKAHMKLSAGNKIVTKWHFYSACGLLLVQR